jgi:hypothetical protein
MTTKKKQTKKFDGIEINQIVSFEENGMIESGVVHNVEEKIFTLRIPSSWNKNGVIVVYDRYMNFFKSGKKTNRFYTYGDAIEVIGRI